MKVGVITARMFFFFFQAEDGIRDYKVTGVQTCALPISDRGAFAAAGVRAPGLPPAAPPPRTQPLEPEELIAETTPGQRRRHSRKAEIVAPPPQGLDRKSVV